MSAPAARHSSRAPAHRSMVPNIIAVGVLAGLSLVAGMAGYMGFEHARLTDAFLAAAMILSGMGPAAPVVTEAGKIFAGLYALYSGLFLVISAGLILSPVLHNIIRRFHLDEDDR